MPIPFSAIPEHIKISIIRKQGIRDFVKLFGASRESFQLFKKIRSKIVVSAFEMHIYHNYRNNEMLLYFFLEEPNKRIATEISATSLPGLPIQLVGKDVCIEGNLNAEFCKWLTHFLSSTNLTIDGLFLHEISCSPAEFKNLLNSCGRMKQFSTTSEITSELFEVAAVEKFQEVKFIYELRDSDLTRLRAPTIIVTRPNLSNFGINFILKEWLNDKRELSYIGIWGNRSELNPDEVLLDLFCSKEESWDNTTKYYNVNDQILVTFIDVNHMCAMVRNVNK